MVSAGPGDPFFQPKRGPAVARSVPPRRKSSLERGVDGSPSKAPELARFNLKEKGKKLRKKRKQNIIIIILKLIKFHFFKVNF